MIAELARPDAAEARRAILDSSEAREIEAALVAAGMVPLRKRAESAVAEGLTTSEEVARVLGMPLG